MENLTYEEITQCIDDYIKSNYDYDHSDNFGDEITYHLYNGKNINITISIYRD